MAFSDSFDLESEGNIKHRRRDMGIFEEHLIKIAHAEKEKRVRILLFPINILLQHGVILVPCGIW